MPQPAAPAAGQGLLTWLHLSAEFRLLLGAGQLQLGAQPHVSGLQDVKLQLRLAAGLAAQQAGRKQAGRRAGHRHMLYMDNWNASSSTAAVGAA